MSISAGNDATTRSTAEAAEPGPRIGSVLGGRFELVEILGAGAHGVVFEAVDGTTNERVALKVLSRLSPDELYRFKREFRVLADVSEEHLVPLHELFVDEAGAFFTMELIRGTDFVSYVRGESDELDEQRLRGALKQLGAGLSSLHAAGKLHRDLKPSNVLVRDDGQVFLADFGLAEELASAAAKPELVGTPAYMSPEQAAGLKLTPASDWYSVGVMLYECLTGAYPFAEAFGKAMLIVKQGPSPAPPSSMRAGVDPGLDHLCRGLLARDPVDRPDAPEIQRSLGGEPALALPTLQDTGAVGRDAELGQLWGALAVQRPGWKSKASVVFVTGASGAGKSTLVDAFARTLPVEAQLLRGRCYERESVPYKGLDQLVDELREYLHERTSRGQRLSAVAGAGALSRLFPVLDDVPGVGDVTTAATAEDPVELRRQAVDALREIFARLARAGPLIMVLEDLQWLDPDTASLLADLLCPKHRPPLMFVATFREDATQRNRDLSRLVSRLREVAPGVRVQDVVIRPLEAARSTELARQMLGARPDGDALAKKIAVESAGSPLFIAELVRYIELGGAPERAGGLSLDEVIQHRAAGLPTVSLRLLEVICVAAAPMERAVLVDAAGLRAPGVEAFAPLRSRSMIVEHGLRLSDTVEPFHDKIRSAISDTLSAERRREIHGALAEQLERRLGDPEAVAYHLTESGEPSRAAGYISRAADQAARALAFKRATRLYELALSLGDSLDEERTRLRIRMADALADDARSAEAAAAYLQAALEVPADEVVALRRKAAEQHLRSGRSEEGIEQLRTVMNQLGVFYPKGPRIALAALTVERTKIRARGTGFVERVEAEADAQDLLRVDATFTAATGLQQVDVMIGQYFQAKHLLVALECGEPHRVARALGIEAMYSATAGAVDAVRTDALIEQVLGLSRRLGDPRAEAIAWIVMGAWSVYRGRFIDAQPHLRRAERLLSTRCINVAWELSMARTFLCTALHHAGDYLGLRRAMDAALADARHRDDHHTALMIGMVFGPIPALAAGDAHAARRIMAEHRHRWPKQLESSTYRYVGVLTDARIERYDHRPLAAWAIYEKRWSAVRRSLMLTKQPFRVFLLQERACSALWAATEAPPRQRRRLVKVAHEDISTLHRERTPWSRAMALSLEPSLWVARGDRARAGQAAVAAQRALLERGMAVHAAAMVIRRGELTEGPRGSQLLEEGLSEMRRRAIEAPAAISDMLVPPVFGWPADT